MPPKDEFTLTTEVDMRFDELFGEEEDPDESKGRDSDTIRLLNSPIKDLKSIVLAVDWEISESIMDRFAQEVARLQKVFEEEIQVNTLLKLLAATGKYIKNKKGEAHPDAIKLLHSSYQALETLILKDDLNDREVKKMIKAEMLKLKSLKSAIKKPPEEADPVASEGGVPDEEPENRTEEDRPGPDVTEENEESQTTSEPEKGQEVLTGNSDHPEPNDSGRPAASATEETLMTPHEAFALALDEIKTLIKTEFEAIRAELKMWRQGQ